jgi:polar amino acid transport system substrate-binding protein
MKKLPVALVAAAVCAVTATAAQARPSASLPTMSPGVLTVAFGDPAVGFAKGQLNGSSISNPRGYEVDLANAIAGRLGLKTKWVYSPWAGLFKPGDKSFDISFQEATITPARAKTVSFTTSYLNANQGVLIKKGISAPKSLADLRKLQTCAQTDTTGLDYIQHKLKPEKAPKIYQSTAAAFTAVAIGQCDALVLDVPIVALQAKSNPRAYGPVAGQIVTHEQYGAVLQKGSKLLSPVNAAITVLTKNGTVAKLQKKWFNISFNSVPVLK